MIIQQRQKGKSCSQPRYNLCQPLVNFASCLWLFSTISSALLASFPLQLIKVNNMLSDTHIELLSKTAEIVLQSRLDPKKSLFSHFQDHLKKYAEMEKNHTPVHIAQFLNELSNKEFHAVRQRLINKQSTHKQITWKVQTLFVLIEKATGKRIEAECWTIQLTRKKELTSSSFGLVLDFLKETILILNKLPLFSIYQKEKELKYKYQLDYKIAYDELWSPTLIDLKNKDVIVRECEEFKINSEISYLASFKHFAKKESMGEESKRKTSVEYEGEKRVSVYAFYDPDLDFTFLSSDDEDFHKKGNSQSIEIRMDIDQVQLSQQFQLLISNQDQEFLDANQELLSDLAKAQKPYLQL